MPGQTPLIALESPVSRTMLGMATADSGRMVKRDFDILVTAWGQQTADTGLVVRFRMGGQEYDQEIGLYHLGARYYDPALGRFLSEDPAGVAASLNLYQYAGNEPVNGRDPSGFDTAFPAPQGVADNEQPWYLSGLDDINSGGGWDTEVDRQQAQDDSVWAAAQAQQKCKGGCDTQGTATQAGIELEDLWNLLRNPTITTVIAAKLLQIWMGGGGPPSASPPPEIEPRRREPYDDGAPGVSAPPVGGNGPPPFPPGINVNLSGLVSALASAFAEAGAEMESWGAAAAAAAW